MVIESPIKGYYVESQKESVQTEKIRMDYESVFEYFRDKNNKYKTNLRYVKNQHWTDDEIEEHLMQGRRPVVFPEVERVLRNIMGTQAQMRMDIKVVPREVNDEPLGSILNGLLKYNDQINDIDFIESDVFRTALIGGVGACSIRWDYDDLDMGYAIIEVIPPNELLWDKNSIKRDLSDARWIIRRQWLPRLDLFEMFPKHHDTIKKATSARYGHSDNVFWDDLTYSDEDISSGMYGDNEDRRLYPLTEYYERILAYSYVLTDEILGSKLSFESMKKAEEYYDGLINGYTEAGEMLFDEDGNSLVTIVRVSKSLIQQTIMVGDLRLEQEISTMPSFPYTLCFSNFFMGDFWGHIDGLIDKQDIINKSWSLHDYLLGTSIKGGYMVHEGFLAKEYLDDPDKLVDDLSQPRPIIRVNSPGAITMIPSNPADPQILNSMSIMMNKMTDDAGGNTMFGIQENAQESAAAIEARARQGGIGRLEFFDNLKLWRKNLAVKTIWYMKNFMNNNQVLRILGTNGNPTNVYLDDGVIDSLKEVKIDITVEEAIKSDSMNERILKQFTDIAIATKMSPEMTLPFMIKLSSLPSELKNEMLSMLPFYVEYTKKQAEAAQIQKLNTEVENSIYREKERENKMLQENNGEMPDK